MFVCIAARIEDISIALYHNSDLGECKPAKVVNADRETLKVNMIQAKTSMETLLKS